MHEELFFFKNVRKIWKLRSTVAICFACFNLLIKQFRLCCKYCLSCNSYIASSLN